MAVLSYSPVTFTSELWSPTQQVPQLGESPIDGEVSSKVSSGTVVYNSL